MDLEISYLELLPKEYKKAVKILLKKLQNANNFIVKYRLFQTFIEKYTGLPEIFDYWFRETINNRSILDNDNMKWYGTAIEQRLLKDFPQFKGKEWPRFNKSHNRLSFTDTIKTFLLLPHTKLSTALEVITEESDEPLSYSVILKYKIACKLYKEIEECDITDSEKYIGILKKTENDEFVIKNVECQLPKNPWCKNLWIAHIQFMEENEKKDGKTLLQVLQRYCRLFFADKKMKEKYRSKMEEFSKSMDGISEFWIDSIKFEQQFNGKKAALQILDKALKSNMKDFLTFCDKGMDLAEKLQQLKMADMIVKAKTAYLAEHAGVDDYNFKRVIKNLTLDSNTKMQSFPFFDPINRYLNERIDYQHLQKLYQICKWFYYKYRYNLVHRFEVLTTSITYTLDDGSMPAYNPLLKFSKSSLTLSPHYFKFSKLNNLWLTNAMSVNYVYQMPQLLSMAVKITLKYLHCHSTEFNYKEFLKLTELKTIEKIHFNAVGIRKGNGYLYIEDILELLPKVKWINFDSASFSPQPSDKLLSLKFENKIQRLELHSNENLSVENFWSFLESNLAPKASLCFYYITYDNYEVVKHHITSRIAKWKPKSEKPELSWNSNDFL